MTKHRRTFRLDRLYHQFMKPKGVPLTELQNFAVLLEAHGFIVSDFHLERYFEDEKLTDGKNGAELFALLQTFKGRLE